MTSKMNVFTYLLMCVGGLAVSLLHVYYDSLGSDARETSEVLSLSPMPDYSKSNNLRAPNNKTAISTHQNQTTGTGRPTFLWGIPTMESEKSQRQLLRETYLRYYKYSDSKSSRNRICSLADLQSKKVGLEDCQIAYVFFVGANPDGPTELVAPNSSFPMTIDPSLIKDAEEDVAYLNIKENMEDGKSQTWFKYGSMLAEDFSFDYIAKVDSDSLFFMPQFLEYVDRTLKPYPHNERVFGGLPFYDTSCDMEDKNQSHACPLPLLGPYYFSGEFYYMSPDLAAYIASDQVDRKKLAVYHEDVDIGNFVFSHPKKVTSFPIEHRQVLRYPNMDATDKITNHPFNDRYWAHTAAWTGGWFKSQAHFRTTWVHFKNYWRFNSVCRIWTI